MANGHGGKRPNSGRHKHIDELEKFKQMDAIATPKEMWERLWKMSEDDTQALKLWCAYRAGVPTAKVELTGKDGEPFMAQPPLIVKPK